MNFYIAFGTIEFLKKLNETHKKDNIALFYNNETATLLHETTKNSIFAAPKKYEVITGYGEIENAGFSALTYVPVTDEGKPLFEYNLTKNQTIHQQTPGLVAFRALRPIKNDTYLIASFWSKKSFYLDWTHSSSFQQLENVIEKTKAGVNQTVFSGSVYTKTYHALKDL